MTKKKKKTAYKIELIKNFKLCVFYHVVDAYLSLDLKKQKKKTTCKFVN